MPRRLHRLALAVLATCLLAPAADARANAAAAFPVGSPAFKQARAIAEAHWGASPCAGEVTYAWTALEPLMNARASWHNPTDPWANAGANFNCRVDFNASTAYDFAMLCTVMTHEVGHLLGHPHVEHHGHLMSAIYTEPIPACLAASAASAQAPAPVAAPAPAPAVAAATSTSAARRTTDRTVARKRTRKARRTTSSHRRRCTMRRKKGSKSARKVRVCVSAKKSAKRGAKRAAKRGTKRAAKRGATRTAKRPQTRSR